MSKKKSVIFVNPDYHCSFILRDEFRKRGWRADVFVPVGFPDKLLYRKEKLSIFEQRTAKLILSFLMKVNVFGNWAVLWISVFYYRYFIFYSALGSVPARGERSLKGFLGPDFEIFLGLLKVLKKRVLYVPSGCVGEELPSVFSRFDNGNVCANCGVEKCSDELRIQHLNVVRRYTNFIFGYGTYDSSQFAMTHVRYKSLDLDLWHPEMEIPIRFRLGESERIRIMHSFYEGGRNFHNRNIKGSGFVLSAVEKLKSEGYPVEYYFVQDVESKDMRYLQSQADIIVDQLIYGWWGSTSIEGMSLGKPVVCYLRKEWKEFFFERFPEYDSLPIIEANTDNIYKILKKLVKDEDYRERKGKESRQFAVKHFDAKTNARQLEEIFLNL